MGGRRRMWTGTRRVAVLALVAGAALAAVRAAVAERPTDTAALARYAELTYRLSGLAQALEPYARLARLEPRNPAWPRTRGRIFMEIDRYELAAQAFRDALRLDPADVDLRFELAEAEFLKGDLGASLTHL